MQTTNRPTPAHGIVVALYHTKAVACYRGSVVALYRGKVVTWWRGDVAKRRARGRPEGQGSHVRAREAESWRKLAGS